MNAATESDRITLNIGDATVTIPAQAAALAYLEQRIDEQRPIQMAAPRSRLATDIGTEYGGGKYAGVTVHINTPFELVLLPGDHEGCTWKDAKAWAESQGGYLPSRFDLLVLWQHRELLGEGSFKDAWYWSSEQRAGDEGYAWYQSFGYGGQYWSHVSSRNRARAVRRLAIQ